MEPATTRRRRPRVLLISQRMDRTGAPAQLVSLLPGLRGALGAHLTLLIGSDGALAASASSHVDRVVPVPKAVRALQRLERRAPAAAAPVVRRAWGAALRWRLGRIDVVYVNSLISTRLAGPFEQRPTIVHVHELGTLADSFGDDGRALVRRAHSVLVPSPVAARWVEGCGVEASRVRVVPGAVPPSAFERPTPEAVAALRAAASITDGAPTIAAVGWIGTLKGSDRFLDVAALMADRHGRAARLLWVGGGSATEEHRFADDIAGRGLEEVVQVLPGMDDLRPLYASADVVLVASREESLSLVALESAAQGTPVVSFPGAGGPDLLAEEGIVTAARTADAGAVVEEIEAVLADPGVRAARGSSARAAVLARHGAEAAQAALVRAVAAALEPLPDPTGADGRG